MYTANQILPFLIVVIILFVDVFCDNGSKQSISFGGSQPLLSNLSTTTPWPQLGQKTYQKKIVPSTTLAPARWVRPTTPASKRDFVSSPKPLINNNNKNAAGELAPSNKRDFVANQNNAQGNIPTSPGRRDYVASPNIPISHNQSPMQPVWVRPTAPSNKRDFVSNPTVIKPGNTIQKMATTSKPNDITAGSQQSSDPTTKPSINDDTELREFSEALLKKDVNNAAKHVTVNYQGKTSSRSLNDEAPQPLLVVNSDAYKIPSVEKLLTLHNNYIVDSRTNEIYTAQEKIEENTFLDLILSTPVLQHTRNFLVQKGKIDKDPKAFRDLLKTIWFNMYSRGGGKIGSSGFEHVFLGELKNDAVSGLHNWLYFTDVENKNMANYLGYMKKLEFGKGSILKYHFNFHNRDKPVGSMFIGTSPEFEIALYSTCFILRPDEVCPLRLGGNNFIIRTYTYRYRGKNMIGSAFPEI